MHSINSDFKLICYEVTNPYPIGYQDHWRREYRNKSIKLEVRQRQYDPKSQAYKNFLIPLLVEVDSETNWHQT